MQSQKVTRSTARHLRRKRMNLARKAEKLTESTEESLIINDNIQKSIKNTINLQIVESLDQKKESENLESSLTLAKSNKSSKKNKKSIKNQDNKERTDTITSSLNLSHKQLNVENDSQTENSAKKSPRTVLDLNSSELNSSSSGQVNKSVKMLENQKPTQNSIIPDKESSMSARLKANLLPGVAAENGNKTPVVDTQSNPPEGKSKAQLRAERRAIQEAQRALKAQKKDQQANEKKVQKAAEPKKEAKAPVAKFEKPQPKVETELVEEKKAATKKVAVNYVQGVFNHLEQKSPASVSPLNSDIHPAIVKLAVKYAEGKATGSNCQCVALLLAFKRFIKDFEISDQQDFVRGLEAEFNKTVEFLNTATSISVTMHNALRRLRGQMSQIKSTETDKETKTILRETIDTYIREQILLAGEAISQKLLNRINDGDVILTYGHSSLVKKILCDAHEKGKKFRVIVVDSRPRLEGKAMLKKLVKENIDCTYVLISAISFVLPQVSFVLLGAHSLLANGAVMARVGTAQVALMSKDFGVPVHVASELNKSDDNAFTDSFVYNELDSSDELTKTFDDTKKSPLTNWSTRKNLNLLNLAYDVTPASLITSVITELAIVPCNSLPVVLRVKPWEV